MFALEFETALFTLTSKTPELEPLFALQPRSTRRKPEHRAQGSDSLSATKVRTKHKIWKKVKEQICYDRFAVWAT